LFSYGNIFVLYGYRDYGLLRLMAQWVKVYRVSQASGVKRVSLAVQAFKDIFIERFVCHVLTLHRWTWEQLLI
jgi:hypothetical protein